MNTTCGLCGQPIEYELPLCGQLIECPGCLKEIQLPVFTKPKKAVVDTPKVTNVPSKLVACDMCGHGISRTALACPGCGNNRVRGDWLTELVAGLCAAIALVLMVASLLMTPTAMSGIVMALWAVTFAVFAVRIKK